MNKSFAWLLAALTLLSVGCLDNIALADRSDGGTTDAPPMDAPNPAVCAACGGVSSPSCLYAPGCRHPQRVCAVNTCGDAIALLACGCDGRTFVTGCITPDRPYQSTGACGDGGVAPQDGGPLTGDVPVDAPTLPYCPEEVDYNAAQNPDLRYRRAAFAIPPDTGTRLDPDASVEVTGTWAGTRTLETSILLGCPAGDIRYACRAETVIRVQQTGGTLHEFVVTASPEDLTALTVGMPVTLHARASQWDGATPVRYSGELIVRRGSDNALMLAIATGTAAPDVGIAVDRATPVCRSRPEPLCSRVLHAYTLHFGGGSGARVIAPTEEAVINEGGTFLCRNRAAYQRVGSGGVECTDVTPAVTSFEIARQP